MKIPRDFQPGRILIILHGSIGDVTRALPMAGSLRRGFPAARIVWSVEPPSLPLLQGDDAINEILVFDRPRWRSAFIGFLSEVRRRKFDLVLDLQRHFKSGLISRWSGAPFRLGFHRRDSKEFNWIFNNLHIEPCGDIISKLDHYGKFTDALGIERSDLRWNFRLTTAERGAVEKHLMRAQRDFAVLFAGTRWQSKQWFPAQIAACADMLKREFGLGTVLLGARADEEIARQSLADARTNVVNLVGRTSLREAIGIIEKAKLAVGPDTGLVHIAAAVGTPVISLWGATDPARTGPLGFADLVIRGRAPCAPCNRRQCGIGRICLQSITSAEIADKATLALHRRRDEDTRRAEGR